MGIYTTTAKSPSGALPAAHPHTVGASKGLEDRRAEPDETKAERGQDRFPHQRDGGNGKSCTISTAGLYSHQEKV